MRERLVAAVARIDALPRRERLALAGGMLALAIGVQSLWIAPTRAKRVAIAASSAESERSRSEAERAAAAERTAAFEALRKRNSELEAKLAALGLKASQREPVGAFVTRSLHGEGVRLAGLTALPVEEIVIADLPLAAPDSAAGDAANAGAAPTTRAPLYRHRTELRLEGPVKSVLRAIEQIERDLVPLRIERVRLSPAGNAGAVQASMVLTTISEERTWLAL